MNPNKNHIDLLLKQHFIRNNGNEFILRRYNFCIPLHEIICYNVGFLNGKKHIQTFCILEGYTTGISSFKIRWWNTIFSDEETPITDFVEFWVHSGISLRKNFFLFEDRFSLFRSSFFFCEQENVFVRLSSIEKYLFFPEIIPYQKIFSSPTKIFYSHNLTFRKKTKRNKQKSPLKGYLKKILVDCNYQNTLEKKFPSFLVELHKILNDELFS